MTQARFGSTEAFSATAVDYASTIAPALVPVAAEVVRRAELRPRETVLDLGTGTGTAARMALGEGRRVIGLDGAPGMLAIARREVPEAELMEADFTAIPLDDRSVDVVLAVHALLFASDRVAALGEWLRVTAPGGRLSFSIPGPAEATPGAIFHDVYDRYEIRWLPTDFPDASSYASWARDAGWTDVQADADPTTVVRLADDSAFRAWMRVGRMDDDRDEATADAFARELMALAPRDADGTYLLPFGALYVSARKPA